MGCFSGGYLTSWYASGSTPPLPDGPGGEHRVGAVPLERHRLRAAIFPGFIAGASLKTRKCPAIA